MVLGALERTLGSRYEVRVAGSAAAANEMLERFTPDAILCDQMMPHMTGSEFLASVQQRFPEIVRIIVSGQEPHEIVSATDRFHSGTAAVIVKPCEPKLLIDSLERIFSMGDDPILPESVE
jgi:two-component system response regulator HupR/HoxA